ncbi:unnamed protein product [Phytomonas sp. Hart1]|nr:unnamed protein product [Phytomonas sp. Hart1]|eukprot:CCW69483.1 unnamed protein product [Phytomonas sp. isolate Hart1]
MRYIAAIDEGTLSARTIIYTSELKIAEISQLAHKQVTPKPGWLEHDPMEIYENCCKTLAQACMNLREKDKSFKKLDGIGITNQRETTVVWDRDTGKPLYNAIVWSDARTYDVVKKVTKEIGNDDMMFASKINGLPASIYFSAFKFRWLLDNVKAVRDARDRGTLMFGTIDTWLIWKLSGGKVHVSDVSNASRVFLMNLQRLEWDEELCKKMDIPISSLPRIGSCSEHFCDVAITDFGLPQALGGRTPITGCIGDQQGALVGNMCFETGEAECTYGTGCFLLMNVGTNVKYSENRLLSTVAYKFGKEPCRYAIEASIANAGATVDWMGRNLGFIKHPKEVEGACRRAGGTDGVVFVPAFGGLFAPYWDPRARGTIVGMTYKTNKANIMYAALEAIAMQVHDNIHAMCEDSGTKVNVLKVNGGLTKNQLLMELQCGVLNTDLMVPDFKEMTSLGAAICAGLAVGTWKSTDEIKAVAARELKGNTIRPSSTDGELWKTKLDDWHRAIKKARWAKL